MGQDNLSTGANSRLGSLVSARGRLGYLARDVGNWPEAGIAGAGP